MIYVLFPTPLSNKQHRLTELKQNLNLKLEAIKLNAGSAVAWQMAAYCQTTSPADARHQWWDRYRDHSIIEYDRRVPNVVHIIYHISFVVE